MTAAHVARTIVALFALVICLSTGGGQTQGLITTAPITLKGAGATFPWLLYRKWIALYHATHPQVSIVYDPVGSGEGIKRFLFKTVDFAASDDFLSVKDAMKVENGAVIVPATAGMIVLAYNIPGVAAQIRLPRNVYVGIFARTIRRWNDPRIQAANPNVHFPARDIAVVARVDSSGTTAAFTRHLAVVDPTWAAHGLETGKLIAWPGTTMLATGNEGVASLIKISEGSIGYVEYSVAKWLNLHMAALQNKAGEFVAPSEAAARLALSAPVGDLEELQSSVIDPAIPGAYPIVSYSWLLLYQHYPDRAKGDAVHDFVTWMLTEGQDYADEFGYSSLSADILSLGRKRLDAAEK